MPDTSRAARDRFLDDVAAGVEDLARASAEQIREDIPSYRAAWETVGPAVEVVVRVTNLKLVDLWREGRQATPDELALLGHIGVPSEEIGIGLEDNLHAYRISAGMTWRNVNRAAAAHPDLPTTFLMEAALVGFHYLNDLSLGITREGMQRARDRMKQREDAERDLLEALVARPPRVEEATRIARILGVSLGSRWRAVVARTSGTASAENLHRIAESLRHPVAPPAEGAIVIAVTGSHVLALVGSDALSDDVRFEDCVIGVGTDRAGPVGLSDSLEEAREALEIASTNGWALARFEDLLLDRVLLGSLSVGQLAEHVLSPLAGMPPRKRRDWELTLAAYLELNGNISETARRLHVHSHTVRYRLAQLRALFGPLLESPDHRLALGLALRSRRHSAHDALAAP